MACKTLNCRLRKSCRLQSDKEIDPETCMEFLKQEDAWWDENSGVDTSGEPLPFTDPAPYIPQDSYISDGDGWE